MKIKIIFRWFDFYMGIYYDRNKQNLYIFFLPMIGLKISLLPQGYSITKFENQSKKDRKDNKYIVWQHTYWFRSSVQSYQIGSFNSFFEAFYYAYHHHKYATYDKQKTV